MIYNIYSPTKKCSTTLARRQRLWQTEPDPLPARLRHSGGKVGPPPAQNIGSSMRVDFPLGTEGELGKKTLRSRLNIYSSSPGLFIS